jgi:hypothetical protein
MNQLQTNQPIQPELSLNGGIEVLVFKTNLSNAGRIADVESKLDIHPGIYKWNIDLNDCDFVLRIVSRNITAAEVENMILNAGYYCEEML